MKQRWTWEQYSQLRKPSVWGKLWLKWLSRVARQTLFPQIRQAAYRLMGMSIGKNVFIGPDCYLDDTFPELIEIRDGAIVSFRVTMTVHGNTRSSTEVAKVTIGNNAYVGTGAIILPGVSIGADATVGAGAVVTHDVAEGAVVAGVPARPMNESGVNRIDRELISMDEESTLPPLRLRNLANVAEGFSFSANKK